MDIVHECFIKFNRLIYDIIIINNLLIHFKINKIANKYIVYITITITMIIKRNINNFCNNYIILINSTVF